MTYDIDETRRDVQARRSNVPQTAPVGTGVPFWDMMLSFGKASQLAMSGYGAQTPRRGATVQHATQDLEVIPVGEETLNVGTRLIAGETTRVRRFVVETPVEQAVTLREERVVVERRKPTAASAMTTQAILTETAFEMSDSFEVVDVWKSVRVTEEVVLRRDVSHRVETVRDTVRRDEVVVEQARPRLAAAVTNPAPSMVPREQPAPKSMEQAYREDPALLEADLKKVAQRFDPQAGKAEASAAAKQGPAQAEVAKPTNGLPRPGGSAPHAETTDKAAFNRKS